MDDYPLVTVNILSFNRREELRTTLTKVFEQDYQNIEVIVVDNASSDGTIEMVERSFPGVCLIKLTKNIGIAGWNEGFKIAKGEYILVLDDDSYPLTGTIKNGVEELKKSDQLGAVAFEIYNNHFQLSETEKFKGEPDFFNGCGALLRKDIFGEVGYYSDLIFIYYNELEFCARLYNSGYKILFLKDSVCIHAQNVKNRLLKERENPFRNGYRYINYFKSYSIFLLLGFDYYPMILFLIKWLMNRIIIALFYGYFMILLKGMIDLVKLFPLIKQKRKVLNSSTQKRYRFGNIELVDRTYFPNFKK